MPSMRVQVLDRLLARRQTWCSRCHANHVTHGERRAAHNENDLRCPISQGEELFVALRMLGRDVEFVRFPGESHELSRSGSPIHRRQRAEIILDFFASHLQSD